MHQETGGISGPWCYQVLLLFVQPEQALSSSVLHLVLRVRSKKENASQGCWSKSKNKGK